MEMRLVDMSEKKHTSDWPMSAMWVLCGDGVCSQRGVSTLQLFSLGRGHGSLSLERYVTPTNSFMRCFFAFAGDMTGGFQSLIQNHPPESQIPRNLHFTVVVFSRPASESDWLKPMFMWTLGLGGGTSIYPTLTL